MSQISWLRVKVFTGLPFLYCVPGLSCLVWLGQGRIQEASNLIIRGLLKVLDGEWDSALKDPLGKHNNPLVYRRA